jgi:hypothetical protein
MQNLEKIWRPHAKQEVFASLPDTIFEALYGGAAGGGKSELLVMLPIIRGFYQEPRFKGIIFRRTYPELESEIIIRSRDWYSHTGARYNEEKKRWTFPSGAIMQFGHLEYEQDVRKYDTAEYNYVGFDELTSFTEFQYIYITRTRCRSSSSNLPAISRSATNPGNVGHRWVRERFVDPAPYGTILIEKQSGVKRIFIQSFAQDNPYLMQNDPQYVSRLSSLPEAERRAKLEGDWSTFEGQVFSDYREERMPDEPENAIHIVAPFPIPTWWPRFLAIDWGYAAMTYALWAALSPDDRLYCYREYGQKERKTSEWATDIGNLSRDEEITGCVMCKSAWQTRGEESTQQELFTRYSGIVASQADDDRILGKLLVQEYLRFTNRSTEPQSDFDDYVANKILIQRGVEAFQSYITSFQNRRREKMPRLQIFENLLFLRKTIPLCIYDKKSTITNKPAEDVREFAGDDPYDTLRYMLCMVNNHLGRMDNESDFRKREDDIIDRFDKNRDFTSYYRRMEYLEKSRDFGERPASLNRMTRVWR